MELRYRGQFNRDIDVSNRKVLEAVRDVILNVKNASDISQIQNLKKLRKYKVHYRIKVAENYRIGVVIRGKRVWFARFGHRKDIYKYFP